MPRPARPEDSPQLGALPELGLGADAIIVGTDIPVGDLPEAVRDLLAAHGPEVELVRLSVSAFGIEFAVREAPGASRLVDHDWDPEDGLSEPSSPRPEDGPWFTLAGVNLNALQPLIEAIQTRVPGAEVDDVELHGEFKWWRLGFSSPGPTFEVRARLDGTVVAIVV